MQEKRMLPPDDIAVKPQKKKTPSRKQSVLQTQERMQELKVSPMHTVQKTSRRSLNSETSLSFQQPEKSTSDSLPDSSSSANEYRALRRKYLLLEEESFGLGKQLTDVENDIKALEEEKLAILDELVVLEGLVDPSEIQYHGKRLP